MAQFGSVRVGMKRHKHRLHNDPAKNAAAGLKHHGRRLHPYCTRCGRLRVDQPEDAFCRICTRSAVNK